MVIDLSKANLFQRRFVSKIGIIIITCRLSLKEIGRTEFITVKGWLYGYGKINVPAM